MTRKVIGFDNSLLPWMGKTMKLIDGYIANRLQEENIMLSKIQWILLKILDDRGPQVQIELAFLTERNKASLTRLINTLERKGYVKRVTSRSDKRSNKVFISEKGKKELQQTSPIFQKIMSEIQSGIVQSEQLQVIGVMKKILINIGENDIKCNLNE